MTAKPRIAIVIGSTRPGRYADKAAGWMLKQAQARDDIEAELLDLLDHPLPFFDEKGPIMSMPSENAEAIPIVFAVAQASTLIGAKPASKPLPQRTPMSQLGHSRRFRDVGRRSALPPQSDIVS
jgi:NADPH-dependent FMN reductase